MPEYIATFGFGHMAPDGSPLGGCYIRVSAPDRASARLAMFDRFGPRWAFLYDTEEETGVQRWSLRDVTQALGLVTWEAGS